MLSFPCFLFPIFYRITYNYGDAVYGATPEPYGSSQGLGQNRYYRKCKAKHLQDRSHDDLFHGDYWIFSILIPQGWAFTFSISSSERSTDHWVET